MHGLEQIDALVYADVEMSGTLTIELWIGSLFDLQRGANGLRDLKIHVHPVKASIVAAGPYLFTVSHEHTAQTEQLDQSLQERVKKGIEAYSKKEKTSVTIANKRTPGTSI